MKISQVKAPKAGYKAGIPRIKIELTDEEIRQLDKDGLLEKNTRYGSVSFQQTGVRSPVCLSTPQDRVLDEIDYVFEVPWKQRKKTFVVYKEA